MTAAYTGNTEKKTNEKFVNMQTEQRCKANAMIGKEELS